MLLVVLAMVALLGLLQGATLIRAQSALRRAETHEAGLRLRAGTEAILWSVVHELADARQRGRPPAALSFQRGFGTVRALVTIEDESGKVDINRAPAGMVALGLATGGCEQALCDALAANAVAWRGRLPGGQGRFRTLGDLAAVPGMPASLIERAAPALTVHSLLDRPAPQLAPAALRAGLGVAAGAPTGAPLGGPGGGIYTIRLNARSGSAEYALDAIIRVSAPMGVLQWQ